MPQRIQAIHAAIEFIEGHLSDPITVADIAAAAGYSLYHFIRTFNQTVRHTPYDYLMRRRLSQAASQLLETERRVVDIALDAQFKNHETFTRAFGRVYGLPPTRWRQRGFADHRLLMPRLDRDYLAYLNAPTFEPPFLTTLEDELTLSGLMAPLAAHLEDVSSLWRDLRESLRAEPVEAGQPQNAAPQDFWGIRFYPQTPESRSFYLAAVEIPALGSAPPTLVTKTIPAGDYLCISPPSPTADWGLARIFLYHTFLPKSGLLPAAPLEIERFNGRPQIMIPVQAQAHKNLV